MLENSFNITKRKSNFMAHCVIYTHIFFFVCLLFNIFSTVNNCQYHLVYNSQPVNHSPLLYSSYCRDSNFIKNIVLNSKKPTLSTLQCILIFTHTDFFVATNFF